MWSIGLTTASTNLLPVIHNGYIMIKRKRRVVARTRLVFYLGLADFVTGFYVTFIASADVYYGVGLLY